MRDTIGALVLIVGSVGVTVGLLVVFAVQDVVARRRRRSRHSRGA